MENRVHLFTSLTVLFFSLFFLDTFLNWNITQDYQIKFDTKGATGVFKDLSGNISFDPEKLDASQMKVQVKVNTIDTGNETKDKHAKGKSWFDAEKYPYIRFTSKRFTRGNAGYQVVGELELHGTKKEITIPFKFKEDNNNGVFEGSFSVNRKDYGIKGPIFGFVVGNEIDIDLSVPVTQKP